MILRKDDNMTEQDKKELESLLMVMNGILLESNMTKENKILKSFIYLEEIENVKPESYLIGYFQKRIRRLFTTRKIYLLYNR